MFFNLIQATFALSVQIRDQNNLTVAEVHHVSCLVRQLFLEKMLGQPTFIWRSHYLHDFGSHLIEDMRLHRNVGKFMCSGPELHVKNMNRLLKHTTRK